MAKRFKSCGKNCERGVGNPNFLNKRPRQAPGVWRLAVNGCLVGVGRCRAAGAGCIWAKGRLAKHSSMAHVGTAWATAWGAAAWADLGIFCKPEYFFF